MMEYYNERCGLIPNEKLNISLDDLKRYWLEIYEYFKSQGVLQLAENGMEKGKNVLPQKMAPSPEQYLLKHVGKKNLYPIKAEKLEGCSESDIFTLIEVYYNLLEKCEWKEMEEGEFGWFREPERYKKDYCMYINELLRFYTSGYYLEARQGYITQLPNEALKQQLQTKDESIPDDVYTKLSDAMRNYYRYDANKESKRKAIATLADILEPLRDKIASVFNSEFQLAKNIHDKCIFEIVNKYSIRHNDTKQRSNYSEEIWFDWMMQYYTSVIIAYYRLIQKHDKGDDT